MQFKFFFVFCLLVIGSLPLLSQVNIAHNRAAYQSSSVNYDNTAHLATDGFTETSWISKTNNNEWIYVDLGAPCRINGVNILWGTGYAKKYKIFIADAEPNETPTNWKEIQYQQTGKGNREVIKLPSSKARLLKIACLESDAAHFEIKELQVMGSGAPVYTQKPQPALQADGKQQLTGGNWKLQRASFVAGKGEQISKNGYDDKDWIPATVPGTVLSSYLDIGALPDPNYGDQQLMISEDFFTTDFWYRNTFSVPPSYADKRVWLNFDGINWKADIYVNGHFTGNIDGSFIRGRFDVTPFVEVGGTNTLAVLIRKNDNPGEVTLQSLNNPGPNGGVLGYDSPTFLSSIGWNWMPTIRGRNTGIWNDVYMDATESVSLENPFVKTDLELPDTTEAKISVEVTVQNHAQKPVKGTINGTIGDIVFERPVELKAGEKRVIRLTPTAFPQFIIKNPKLWWPNGYGAQDLYTLDLKFVQDQEISDQKSVDFGIREYAYQYEDGNLRIHINGHPLMIRGGNWGMSDAMLRCDKEGYDVRVRMHKDMNMNMIRNWIGMIGDEAFYEACDKYGIMVWDDFWLANPLNGTDPKDEDMFMDNMRDKMVKLRNHASIAIWCGRNEGFPPATLDSAMRIEAFRLDGTRYYLSNSADWPVTGLGPYNNRDPKWYFNRRGTTFHSEQGIVAVPPVESIKAMMPEDKLWPINDMWGVHDWTQERVTNYFNSLNGSYGEPKSLEDFVVKSQMMNMEGPKAMFESWQSNRGSGVLVWMTHPAWPSFICQAYDYYLEPNAAYFAFKKGGAPVHVLLRPDNNRVEVANNLRTDLKNVTVTAKVYDSKGNLVFSKELKSNVVSNSLLKAFLLEYPDTVTPVHFIKLELKDETGNVLSDNFYWRGKAYQDYTALQELPEVDPEVTVSREVKDDKTFLKVSLKNNTSDIALMARLKVVGKKTGKRLLPVFYEDNYFSLVPEEAKTVMIEIDNKHTMDDIPQVAIEGWNIKPKKI